MIEPHGSLKTNVDWLKIVELESKIPLRTLTSNLNIVVFCNWRLMMMASEYAGRGAFQKKIVSVYAEHKEAIDQIMNLLFEDVQPDWFELTLEKAELKESV